MRVPFVKILESECSKWMKLAKTSQIFLLTLESLESPQEVRVALCYVSLVFSKFPVQP